MKWIRANIVLVVFLAAVALSFVVSTTEARRRDEQQRQTLVGGCTRTSGRTSVLVAAQDEIAQARRERGDTNDLVVRAESLRNGLLFTIPAPKELGPTVEARMPLAEVEQIKDPSGATVYRPTARATALTRAGCEVAYPKP